MDFLDGSTSQLVSTTTANSFLTNVFADAFSSIGYVLLVIWPYLIVVAIVWAFWRIGRAFFRR